MIPGVAYRLSCKAADDLRRIYVDSMRMFGADQAARYHARLGTALDILAAQPFMARERLDITPPVRVHPCGSHVIVYLVEISGDILLRIRHGRKDWVSDPR